MARVQFKQKCQRCKKNYVLTTRKHQYLVCYECQKKELSQPVQDSEMRKLFDIPEEFYKESTFLRNIKINYLKFENLTQRQIEAFKKTVEDMKEKNQVNNT